MDRSLLRALAPMGTGDDRPNVRALTRDDIRSWAEAEDGGRMHRPQANYFSGWLICHLHDFADDSGFQTNADVLKNALDAWVNGYDEDEDED